MDASYLVERAPSFRALEKKFGRLLRIYGSIATGSAKEQSDIDILIIGPPLAGPALADLKGELGTPFGRVVDLVEQHALIPILRRRILSEARPIDVLASGAFARPREKPPYLNLLIIQNEAGDLMLESTGSADGRRRVGARARRMAYFYRQRFMAMEHGCKKGAYPLGQIRELARVVARSEQLAYYSRAATAQLRKQARKIIKRLNLSPRVVESAIFGVPPQLQ